MSSLFSFIYYSLPDFFKHPLWKNKPFIPLLRFLFLQLYFLIKPGKKFHLLWLDKIKLEINKGDHELTGNFYFGLNQFNDMSFLLHFLRSSDLFLDVGANMGSYSLLASGIIGSKVLAIEPVLKTFGKLERLIELNHLSNRVQLYNLALGLNNFANENSYFRFSADRNGNDSIVEESYDEISELLRYSSLDHLFDSKTNLSLIKIDVEGSGYDVLKGSTRILNSLEYDPPVFIIEAINFDLTTIMHSFGYEPYTYTPSNRRILTLSDDSIESQNLIWIHSSQLLFVQKRLLTAAYLNLDGTLI